MSMYEHLIEQAKLIIRDINYKALSNHELAKEAETSFWPGHTIVTYPFHEDLKKDVDNLRLVNKLSLNKLDNLNLYVHIPFCTGICGYCGYSKSANVNKNRKQEYINSIKWEIDKWIETISNNKIELDSLYIGGGTPTDLSAKQLEDILYYIRSNFSWKVNVEATCEGSPETLIGDVGSERLETIKINGITRVSIGVQSFDDYISKKISNRRHTGKQAIESIELIKDSGFDNFNIDMMYGMPQQSIDEWIDSLSVAVSLEVPSITLYPLKVKDKSVWAKKDHGSFASFNYSTERILLFSIVGKIFLESNGYTQNTVYWFVKSDSKSFKQQRVKYEMSNLLGIGCSAYSYVNNCQFFNIYSESNYMKAVQKQDRLPLELGRELTSDELMKRFIIFGIKRGFLKEDFYNKYGKNVYTVFPILNEFILAGLINDTENYLTLTDLGKLFADEIGVRIHRITYLYD